jgi:carboxymethylenebutenolidase
MDCYLAAPTADRRYPLIILFMDVWGWRQELFAMARRVAANGYCCVVPDLFYRHGQLNFERRNAEGRTVSFDSLPLEVQQHMQSFSRQVVRETIAEDVGAIFMAAASWPVASGPAGAIGFCLGGRAAFYTGQVFPEKIRAVASLHGTLLFTDDVSISGHTQLDRMHGEVYCGFGALDGHTPPIVRSNLQELFEKSCQVGYKAVVHPGAKHGYAMPDRDVYDSVAAERDWVAIFEMFKRQLDQ